MSDAEPTTVVWRTYTAARRHPLVIGRWGKSYAPIPLTLSQLVVLAVTAVSLYVTRGVWAHLGPTVNMVVAVGLPIAATWAVRHTTVEGRDPLRALLGAAEYAAARAMAPRGLYLGWPVATPRPRRAGGQRVVLGGR